MTRTTTRFALATAALAASLTLAVDANAVAFLNTDQLTRFCTDKYGANAVGEGPSVGSFNRVNMQCAVPDASNDRALVHTQEVEEVCAFLTGYETWVNDRGNIVCIGRPSDDSRRGSGTN